MKENVVKDKSYRFAIRIVNLYKVLGERHEYVLSKQLLRSGTAVGAMIKEGLQAQSKADFIHKLSIALKEACESEYWIMLLKDTTYIKDVEYESILPDCQELIKLLTCIIKTAKNTRDR